MAAAIPSSRSFQADGPLPCTPPLASQDFSPHRSSGRGFPPALRLRYLTSFSGVRLASKSQRPGTHCARSRPRGSPTTKTSAQGGPSRRQVLLAPEPDSHVKLLLNEFLLWVEKANCSLPPSGTEPPASAPSACLIATASPLLAASGALFPLRVKPTTCPGQSGSSKALVLLNRIASV